MNHVSTSSGLHGAFEEPSREGALSVGQWVRRRIHFPEMLGSCAGSLPSPALEMPQFAVALAVCSLPPSAALVCSQCHPFKEK